MAAKRGKKQVTRILSERTSLKVLLILVLFHATCTTVVRPSDTRQPHLSTTAPHHDHHELHHSRAHVNRSDPSFRYMYELYKLMVRQERSCCLPNKGEHEKPETIRSIPGVQGGDFSSQYLSFDISSLEDSENITLVQVAVSTRVRHHSSCHVHLEVPSNCHWVRPACQHKPFNISHLDVFNVTSSLIHHLTSNSGSEPEFTVLLNSSGHIHVHNAFLVIFQGIDADELLNQRCRPCPAGQQSVGAETHAASSPQRRRRDAASGRDTTTEALAAKREGLESGTGGGGLHFLPWDISSSSRQQRSSNAPASGDANPWLKMISTAFDFVRGIGAIFREGSREASATFQKTKGLDSIQQDHVAKDTEGAQATKLTNSFRERGERSEARSPVPSISPLSARQRVQLLHERRRRQAEENESASYERPDSVCQVTDLILHPAHDLGMLDVIFPELFSINLCAGRCSKLLPLSNSNSTHYSFLTSLFTFLHPEVAALRNPPVPRPQCIPSAFAPMSVYLLKEPSIFVERWWSAIVQDCQCV